MPRSQVRDGTGRLERAKSDPGDTAKIGDEECTTTVYARNADKNILDLVKEEETVATACDKTPSLPGDLISDARTYYDSAPSLDTPPAKGDVTRTDEQDAGHRLPDHGHPHLRHPRP